MKQKISFARIVNFRPLFYGFLAFLFGIISAYRLFGGDAVYISLVTVSLILAISFCMFYRKWMVAILVVLCFFAGSGCYFLAEHCFVGKSYTEKQEVVARVSDDISENSYYYSVVLEDCFISEKADKGIRLSIRKSEGFEIQTGDIISFNSYVNKVHLWEMGDFNSFYVRDNTAYTCVANAEDITLIHGNAKVDEKIRQAIKDVLFENMSAENAGTAFAVLTGDKSVLNEDIEEVYRGTGIIHLLTVSGLHISFLIAMLGFVLKKCKVNKYIRLAITAVFLIFYCYICGFTPSVVRATIMGLVLMCAPMFGREYDKLTSLAVAGFLILFINPLYALDVGFLMSFSCVAAIFLLYNPISKTFKKFLPEYFAKSIAVSLSAQIGILPFLASFGQDLNFLSLIVNVLLVPIFGVLFILLFASTLLSFIPYVGIILKLSDWGFSGIYHVAEFFDGTIAKIRLSNFSPIISAMIFLLMFVLSNFLMVSKKFKALFASIILAGMSVFILVDTLVVPRPSSTASIVCAYDDGSMFLTNKKGEVLYVGNDFYGIHQEFLDENKLTKINYMLAIDVQSVSGKSIIDDLRKNKIQEIYAYKDFTEAKEELVVEKNTAYQAGDYNFEYIFVEESFVGVKIDFDNSSIFFATNKNLSYNAYRYITEEISLWNLDFVYLSTKSDLAPLFVNSGHSFGIYDYEGIGYSYYDDGNISFNFTNGKVRSLD